MILFVINFSKLNINGYLYIDDFWGVIVVNLEQLYMYSSLLTEMDL